MRRRLNLLKGVRTMSSSKKLDGVERLLRDFQSIPLENIRTFSIIAHIDHGKSTLADALLKLTGNIKENSMPQLLDSLKVERERGITVKAHTVSMIYTDEESGQEYLLNLVDTPGHVDFSYEVTRSLSGCQGALLLVDSCQGIQAQTIANYNLAKKLNLDIIGVLTKLDLSNSQPAFVKAQMEKVFKLDPKKIVETSAKTGFGINNVLPAVIDNIMWPEGNPTGPLRALLLDSWFDEYRGVICLIEIRDGKIATGDVIQLKHMPNKKLIVSEVGLLTPEKFPVTELSCGHVGYLIAGLKALGEARVGDTFHHVKDSVEALPGFEAAKPMIFASIYPVDSSEFSDLRNAVDKLLLNDASVTVVPEASGALGMGMRCGFLGVLHMEVFQQRLLDDFGSEVITTAPMVPYKVIMKDGRELQAETPAELPPRNEVEAYYEPTVIARIATPSVYVGSLLQLMHQRRGEQIDMEYLDDELVLINFRLPWQEVVVDLYDSVKSVTAGFASFDYTVDEPRAADVVRVDILVNGKAQDALAFVCHRDQAEESGRKVCEKLKEVVKRQLFEVTFQAAINNKIFAKTRIAPYRKDVLIKSGKVVGGGDPTRKLKLLEAQKEGKKAMKTIGNVPMGQEAFQAVLSRGN